MDCCVNPFWVLGFEKPRNLLKTLESGISIYVLLMLPNVARSPSLKFRCGFSLMTTGIIDQKYSVRTCELHPNALMILLQL